jgi:hypothetical protein
MDRIARRCLRIHRLLQDLDILLRQQQQATLVIHPNLHSSKVIDNAPILLHHLSTDSTLHLRHTAVRLLAISPAVALSIVREFLNIANVQAEMKGGINRTHLLLRPIWWSLIKAE